MEVSGKKKNPPAAGSQSSYELACEPCNRKKDKHIMAVALCLGCDEYICKTCVEYHDYFVDTKDHVLLEGDNMPKTKPHKRKERAPKPEEECTDICEKHQGELVKYFCRDHNVVGCTDCITIEHKECTKAQMISVISCQQEAKQLCKSFKTKLHALTADIGRFLRGISENKVEANKQYIAAITNIRKYKSEIVDALNAFEKQIEKEAKELKEADMKSMDDIFLSCKTMSKDIVDLETAFDTLQNDNKKSQLFTLVHKTRTQLDEWEIQNRDIHMRNKIQNYTFEPDDLFRDLLQNTSGLGKLVRKNEETQQTNGASACLEDTRENQRQSRWKCPNCSSGSQQIKLACGHLLCLDCVRYQNKNERPCSDCGVITGSQPQGSQNTSNYHNKWIKMTFTFPDGIQLPRHPQPGQQYCGKTLVCFLENDARGQYIIRLIDLAFKRGLIGRIQNGYVHDNVGLFKSNPREEIIRRYWESRYEIWVSKVTKRLKDLGIHE